MITPRVSKANGKAPWITAFPEQVNKPMRLTFDKKKKPAKYLGPLAEAKPVRMTRSKEEELYAEEAREFVRAAIKAGKTCPVVAVVPELQRGRKYGHKVSATLNEVHHCRGRSGPLLRDQRFWVAISKQGHRWVHANKPAARALGFLCPAGEWNSPVPEDVVVTVYPPGLLSFAKGRKTELTEHCETLSSPRDSNTATHETGHPEPTNEPATPAGERCSSLCGTGPLGDPPTNSDNMADVYLTIGDVVVLDGEQHVVDYTNDSRARCVPLTKRRVHINQQTGPNAGQTVEFDRIGNSKNISPRVDRAVVVQRLGAQWVADWKVGKVQPADNPTQHEERKDNSMAAKKKPAKKAEGKSQEGSNRARIELFGHGACAVIRAAGKAGATTSQVTTVFEAHKVKVSAATIAIQLGKGRKGVEGAKLTAEQIKEFTSAKE